MRFAKVLIVTAVLSGFSFAACSSKSHQGPAERAGEKIDEGMSKVGEKMEEGGEKLQEKARGN